MRILITLICLISIESFAQNQDYVKTVNSYGFRLIPSLKDNIYGICIGLVGSETICNVPKFKKSHGLNVQLIGQGLFVILNRKAFSFSKTLDEGKGTLINTSDTNHFKAKHNGIIVSSFGTFTDIINGVSFSVGASLGYEMNGISLNLFNSKYGNAKGLIIALINHTGKMTGVQIGMLNKTNNLKGLQFGLWNVNSKRKLPLLNWSF